MVEWKGTFPDHKTFKWVAHENCGGCAGALNVFIVRKRKNDLPPKPPAPTVKVRFQC